LFEEMCCVGPKKHTLYSLTQVSFKYLCTGIYKGSSTLNVIQVHIAIDGAAPQNMFNIDKVYWLREQTNVAGTLKTMDLKNSEFRLLQIFEI
jgi:hypothetical protein